VVDCSRRRTEALVVCAGRSAASVSASLTALGNYVLPAQGELLTPRPFQFLTEKADPDTKIFPWSMPARFYVKSGTLIIYGTALVAGQTRKGDVYSKEELARHGCTLIGGPIELFEHSWVVGEPRWLAYPDNVILDAEEVDGHLEYIARIADPQVIDLIRGGEINHVSINALCRYGESPGDCRGMILNGFCLVGKNDIPASAGTCVKSWNTMRFASSRRLQDQVYLVVESPKREFQNS
jgi:hypothetical protein